MKATINIETGEHESGYDQIVIKTSDLEPGKIEIWVFDDIPGDVAAVSISPSEAIELIKALQAAVSHITT